MISNTLLKYKIEESAMGTDEIMGVYKKYGFLKYAKYATDKGALAALSSYIDLGEHNVSSAIS